MEYAGDATMTDRTPGACHCGTRLARDNTTGLCGACTSKVRNQRVEPPLVPSSFWQTEGMREALASRHMGRVIHAYRTHPYHTRPIPQATVAHWVELNQAQLSRIENGQPIKDLDKLIQWAYTLRIPADLLWFTLPSFSNDATSSTNDQPEVPQHLPETVLVPLHINGQHIALPVAADTLIGVNPTTITRISPGAALLDVRDARTAPRQAESPDPRHAELLRHEPPGSWDHPDDVLFDAQALRASNIGHDGLDRFEQRVAEVVAEYEHRGPAILGPPTAQLRRRAHQVLQGHQPPRLRHRMYRVTAQLAGLLGYMAVNTGRFRLADAYCAEALELAEEIGDVDLQVWVYGTRSLGAYYAGEYETAHLHAVRGRELAPTSPQSIRLLANGEARALGQLGDREGTDAAIGQALDVIDRHGVAPELTPCISFDPYGYARVAANAATAYVPLGDTGQVLRYTGDVDTAVEQADSDWSRALVRLDVANALLRQQDPDLEQAAVLGQQALEVCAGHPIRSVWQRAREVQELTVRWSGDPRVTEYADALRAWRVTPEVRAITTEPVDNGRED